MRRKTKYDRDALHFAPFVLFPSPFPEKNFDRVVNIQLVVNELFHKVAHDHEFLRDTLRNTVEVDEFTGRLWGIYQTICDEGGSSQVVILYVCLPRPSLDVTSGQPGDDEVRLHAGQRGLLLLLEAG